MLRNPADIFRFPSAQVTIRDGMPISETYARMVFAPTATICNPSTFCFWPTLASAHGFLPETRLLPAVPTLAKTLPNVEMINPDPRFVSYADFKTLNFPTALEVLSSGT